jgi:hypothetical protein
MDTWGDGHIASMRHVHGRDVFTRATPGGWGGGTPAPATRAPESLPGSDRYEDGRLAA